MANSPLNVAVGATARAARQRAKLGLTPVCRAMGCNKQNLSMLEHGAHGWTVARLVSFARAVGVPAPRLLRDALKSTDETPQADPVPAPPDPP